MANISQITDHTEAALDRLLEQFKYRPNIEAFITALVSQIQDIESAAFDLYLNRWILSAQGAQLDNLGAIVLQPRQGRLDPEYRAWIAARILSNRSDGIPDDLIRIAQLVLESLDEFEIQEQYPAGLVVKSYNSAVDPQTLFEILNATKPAGVRLILEYSPSPFELLFRFAPGDDPIDDAGYGFDDGLFAGAID